MARSEVVELLLRRAQPKLTMREIDVLVQLLQFLPATQASRRAAIADSLALSENTVRTHLRAVFRKLQVHNTEDLFRCLLRDLVR